MNRRGFIAALAGIATWAKTSFSLSPAASAIPPTREDAYCSVSFVTRNGHVTPVSLPNYYATLTVERVDVAENTIWLS